MVNSSASGSTYGNGVEFIPLRKSQADSIEFQLRADSAGTMTIKVMYAMSAANGGNVRLRADRRVTSVGSDPSTALTAGTAFSITPGNDANAHAATSSDSSDLSFSVSAGDLVRVKLTRINDGNDTHTGDLRVLAVTAVPS